jgi:DNA replication protein DnaC
MSSRFFNKKLKFNSLPDILKCKLCGNDFEKECDSLPEDYSFLMRYVFPYFKDKNYVCFSCYSSLSEREQKKFNTMLFLRQCGVYDYMSSCSFDNFIETNENKFFLENVKNWYESGTNILSILSNHVGIGKTHLAISCLAEEYFRNEEIVEEKCIFVNERDVYGKIQESFHSREFFKEDIMFDLVSAEWLIIDDVFSNGDSDFNRKVILEIVDKRIDCKGRTIFTSNLTIEEIGRIDKRLSSRLSFRDKCKIVQANSFIPDGRPIYSR